MEVSLYALIAVLLGTNTYWAYVCLQLTNRLMSRDFGTYAQAIKKPVRIKPIPEDMSDPLAEDNAHKANSLLSLI